MRSSRNHEEYAMPMTDEMRSRFLGAKRMFLCVVHVRIGTSRRAREKEKHYADEEVYGMVIIWKEFGRFQTCCIFLRVFFPPSFHFIFYFFFLYGRLDSSMYIVNVRTYLLWFCGRCCVERNALAWRIFLRVVRVCNERLILNSLVSFSQLCISVRLLQKEEKI